MKGMLIFFLLPLSASLLFSCNSPVSNGNDKTKAPATSSDETKPDSLTIKTGWAIEKLARQDLQAGGFKVLSFALDSLKLVKVSMKDFYFSRKEKLVKEKAAYHDVTTRLSSSGILPNPLKLKEDSLKTSNALKTLESLYAKASDKKEIIFVTYKIIAKTNAADYNNVYSKYLEPGNFTEIKVRFADNKQ